MAIIVKSRRNISAMQDAAKINVEALQAVDEAIRPGVTTGELDKIAHDIIVGHGAIPSFYGYPSGSRYPYPATITASINEELVHGIPGDRVLQEGDIVSIDCGTTYKGWVADSAFTAPVGRVSDEALRLLEITESSLYKGIEICLPDRRFGDVSNAIQTFVEGRGYNVVREYGGHGVGRNMHEEPHIPNWGRKGQGHRMRPGMTFALEPMVMAGSPQTQVLDDHWTVVMADGGLCAHFEHTIAVTENGPEILTKWE
ncbi:MAG: type I methionyl aminopeptidase [Anaerolineae bacterium]|nr:type I methionyl aminopeptidase [Anaerolineae bacterium]